MLISKKIFLLVLFLSSSTQSFAEQVPSCDRDQKPWLDENCREPNVSDPNDACRRVSQMKAEGMTFNLVKKRAADHLGKLINTPDQLAESIVIKSSVWAWEICDSVVKLKCSQSATALLGGYGSIVRGLVGAPSLNLPAIVEATSNTKEVDLNIARNFDLISLENNALIKEIAVLNREMTAQQAVISDYQSLLAADRKLFDSSAALKQKFAALAKKEFLFKTLLENSSLRMAEAVAESKGYAEKLDCSYMAETMAPYREDVRQHFMMVNGLAQDVAASRKQREELLAKTYKAWKWKNHSRYAEKIGKDIQSVEQALNRDMALDNLLWTVNAWWAEVNANGPGESLHSRYFYHTVPLELLKLERARALVFKEQIAAATKGDASAIEANKIIDSKINILESNISFITAKGWKGLLDLQKTSATKRAEMLPGNSRCQSLTLTFLEKAEDVDDLSAFDSLSDLYKQSVDTCVK
ncbi:MAG: hypothetical protein EOP07_10390 [Proteobacteria bacterium]|nr:MAG: hypothetical protein EOP07_10390 [Pseudomonadota bacterium]